MNKLLAMTSASLLVLVAVACTASPEEQDAAAGQLTAPDAAAAGVSKASGYDLEGPKALPDDKAPVEMCAAVVSDVEAACAAASGVAHAANGCKALCSIPIAAEGKAAGYDLEGYKQLPSARAASESCTQEVSVVAEACSRARGVTTAADGCKELCSVPIARKGAAAGFDLEGFKTVEISIEQEFCPGQRFTVVRERCTAAGGRTTRVLGCIDLCSLPL